MTVLALLLALVAFLVFCLAAAGAPSRLNLTAAGLAILSAAWIVQELGVTHHLHVS